MHQFNSSFISLLLKKLILTSRSLIIIFSDVAIRYYCHRFSNSTVVSYKRYHVLTGFTYSSIWKSNTFSRLFLSQSEFLFVNLLIFVVVVVVWFFGGFFAEKNMPNLQANATRNNKKYKLTYRLP